MDYSTTKIKNILVGCKVEDINNDTFIARNGEYGIVYHNNHRISPKYNELIVSKTKKFIAVSNNDLWGLLDDNGNGITGIKYKRIDIYDDIACLYDNGYTFIINNSGDIIEEANSRIKLVFRYLNRYLVIAKDSMAKTYCVVIQDNEIKLKITDIKLESQNLLEYNLLFTRESNNISETYLLNIKTLSIYRCEINGTFESQNLVIKRMIDGKILNVTKLIHNLEPDRIGGA